MDNEKLYEDMKPKEALPDLLKTALLDMIEWWQGRQPTP